MEEKHISLLHLKFMSEIVRLILNLYFLFSYILMQKNSPMALTL